MTKKVIINTLYEKRGKAIPTIENTSISTITNNNSETNNNTQTNDNSTKDE